MKWAKCKLWRKYPRSWIVLVWSKQVFTEMRKHKSLLKSGTMCWCSVPRAERWGFLQFTDRLYILKYQMLIVTMSFGFKLQACV